MYSIVIPPELLGELCGIRERTGMSIRKQIINAIIFQIKNRKT